MSIAHLSFILNCISSFKYHIHKMWNEPSSCYCCTLCQFKYTHITIPLFDLNEIYRSLSLFLFFSFCVCLWMWMWKNFEKSERKRERGGGQYTYKPAVISSWESCPSRLYVNHMNNFINMRHPCTLTAKLNTHLRRCMSSVSKINCMRRLIANKTSQSKTLIINWYIIIKLNLFMCLCLLSSHNGTSTRRFRSNNYN